VKKDYVKLIFDFILLAANLFDPEYKWMLLYNHFNPSRALRGVPT
tara:strand:- start:501 stop:635 length:135 start_codon:yes stop_codon:yes gene_type:complete